MTVDRAIGSIAKVPQPHELEGTIEQVRDEFKTLVDAGQSQVALSYYFRLQTMLSEVIQEHMPCRRLY